MKKLCFKLFKSAFLRGARAFLNTSCPTGSCLCTAELSPSSIRITTPSNGIRSMLFALLVTKETSGMSQPCLMRSGPLDRKSTRLNSSHVAISYAVFCLKKKKINKQLDRQKKKQQK